MHLTGQTGNGARLATLHDALTVHARGGRLVRLLRTAPRVLLWASLRAGLRLRVEGARRPGPAVVVSNHPHVIDGLVVLFADPLLRPIARWHRRRILRVGMWVSDCVITTTGTPVQPPKGAFAEALAHVRGGGRVWIAPEGGCQPDLALRPPRSGAVRIAHAAGVPVQVLGVIHERHPGPRLAVWRPWHRPGITLRWGPVLTASGDVAADNDRLMRALAATTGSIWTPVAADVGTE